MADARNTAPRDLIGDIHAQQRRRLFRRVALVVALFLILLLIAVAFKLFAERRERAACLDDAREGFALGTAAELGEVAEGLGGCLEDHPDDPGLLGARALTRAQLLAEFGEGEQAAREAVDALPDEPRKRTRDGELARVMVDLDAGALAEAREHLAAARELDEGSSIAPGHEIWVGGMLAIADPEADLDAAIDRLAATDEPSISIRRLLATLHMHAGDSAAALEELGRAREQSRTHLGLAADEALYNALLREKLAGVADVADQLLGGGFAISTRDRAHALLARGVADVQAGEVEAGMKLVAEAWAALPGWDKLSRTLALEMAMEAGDGERARAWIDEAGLRAPESAIYAAWVELVEGDVMTALVKLAELPQTHPRVALLQGLALVEQSRWAEAEPWLARADELLPGRIDVEVARARAEVHTGDPEAARRKLEAIAEEEPFAPRAWTGLGEAHLAVALRRADAKTGEPEAAALSEARRAFKWAVQRERLPAEAYLQLAELTERRRLGDPKLAAEVLDLLTKAVEANDHLPRYAEREALYLAELGRREQAMAKLEAVHDRPGASWRAAASLARVALEQVEYGGQPKLADGFEDWLEKASELAAPAPELERLRARALLQAGDAAGAQAKLEALLAADEGDVEARVYQVRALMERRDRDAALASVRRGVQAVGAPDSARLNFEWAQIMARGGKRRAAASRARLGWRQLGDQRGPATGLVLWAGELTVRLLQRDGQAKPAASVARELTERLPTVSNAWVVRAYAELRSNRGSDAKASAEKAVELDADNPRAHEVLGQLWMRFGRKDRAAEAFRRAVELAAGTPDEAAFRKNLADL